ncbi:hypothetical protein KIV56_05630 [Cryobacterium breve]|uniref:ADP-ribosylglycohydrolase family protein n=1 Tax=Cryobacterium breve TaxID=1259258 RepID=A0ABY7NGE0_9MICO|nr:hypothetical protein [Cryobacterium breve]WBM80812.1 hypothetical protein KIV56_05630 [Cryobacterium breve]
MLTPEQHDRSAAVLLGLAAGDALASGDDFEWSERTAAAVDIALLTADGRDPSEAAVREDLGADGEPEAADPAAATRTAGRRLLRTAPVALALLDDPVALAEAARLVCSGRGTALTDSERSDPSTDRGAGDAAVLFGLSLRVAVLEGRLDALAGLAALPTEVRAIWEAQLTAAGQGRAVDVRRRGTVGGLLQGAWAILGDEGAADASRVERVISRAAQSGADPASVAAAGALLAGRWGLEAVPVAWRRLLHGRLHGRPDLVGVDLVRLGMLSARSGVPHDPDDPARMDVLR